ncbi:hypothetical protein [Kibdelosporangium aridum]|uniref:hypothetical protein n=1 Tax=Kibdelosporangium aridum TaxID=2030 RepID=UPI00052712EE
MVELGDYEQALNHLRSMEDSAMLRHTALDEYGLPISAVHLAMHETLAREAAATSAEIEALTGMAWAGHDSDYAVEALNLARTQGLRLLEAKALTALADTKLRRGQAEAALRIAEQALGMHREFGCVPGEREALAVVSRVKEN